jgi:hypothetical protein
LNIEDISGSCRRDDYTPLGISRQLRHAGIVPSNAPRAQWRVD